jgi:hypothetical protein
LRILGHNFIYSLGIDPGEISIEIEKGNMKITGFLASGSESIKLFSGAVFNYIKDKISFSLFTFLIVGDYKITGSQIIYR